MSPRRKLPHGALDSFPRVSGDEPGISRDEDGDTPFSPRERG